MTAGKTKLAVHKFSSCDGCQLAFLNMGEDLLTLFEQVDVVHFAEAGPVDTTQTVDISFVEGSLSTREDIQRIRQIRENSQYVITIGACATAGGLQALRNIADQGDWVPSVYARPEHISLLEKVMPVNEQIKVDFEINGCPVNTGQVTAAVRSLLDGVTPVNEQDKLCLSCKRQHHICVIVARGLPCMGPVTRTGCGALCPGVGRDCYGCFGAAENSNVPSLGRQFSSLQLDPKQISHRFVSFNSADPVFRSIETTDTGHDD